MKLKISYLYHSFLSNKWSAGNPRKWLCLLEVLSKVVPTGYSREFVHQEICRLSQIFKAVSLKSATQESKNNCPNHRKTARILNITQQTENLITPTSYNTTLLGYSLTNCMRHLFPGTNIRRLTHIPISNSAHVGAPEMPFAIDTCGERISRGCYLDRFSVLRYFLIFKNILKNISEKFPLFFRTLLNFLIPGLKRKTGKRVKDHKSPVLIH